MILISFQLMSQDYRKFEKAVVEGSVFYSVKLLILSISTSSMI